MRRAIAFVDIVLLSVAVGVLEGRAARDDAPAARPATLTRAHHGPALTTTTMPTSEGPIELVFTRRLADVGSPTEVLAIRADGSELHAIEPSVTLGVPPLSFSNDRTAFSKALSITGGGTRSRCNARGCSTSTIEGTGIATADLDGTDERVLTRGGWDTGPVFSPDGTRIAFHRHIERQGTAADMIAIVDLDGRGLRELPPPPGATDGIPAWSPDSRSIATERMLAGNKPTIVLLDTQGGPARTIATGSFGSLSWAHDGGRLAGVRDHLVTMSGHPGTKFSTGNDVWTIYADGSQPAQVTWLAGDTAHLEANYCGVAGSVVAGLGHPLWSPDDQHIGFTSSYRHLRQLARQRDVMIIRADGTGLRTLYAAPPLACPAAKGPEVLNLLGWR